MSTYPYEPGSKGTETSAAAADAIAQAAPVIRAQCLNILRQAPGGLTADEVAARLGASVLTVRPRISELKQQGDIVDSGARRKNASGVNAAVWTVRTAPTGGCGA